MSEQTTTTSISCPNCRRTLLLPAGWIKVRCECGEIVKAVNVEKTRTKAK